MLDDFNPNCSVQVRGCIYEIGSVEVDFKGAGFGLLISMIIKSATYSERKRWVRRLIEDFEEAKNPSKDDEKKDGDEMAPYEEMMEPAEGM